jgi:hypothetical protein
LREAAINATLNHPNVVTTYSYDLKPLGVRSAGQMDSPMGTRGGGNGVFDWQLYIIQVHL